MIGTTKPDFRHSKIPAQGRAVPGSVLVLDGSEVKLRLVAERTAHKTPVHVDWVRFTCLLRNVIPKFTNDLQPSQPWQEMVFDPVAWRTGRMTEIIKGFAKEHQDPLFIHAMQQAFDLAKDVCNSLGPDFFVHHEIGKGHDFYKYRWSIYRNGAECGWVGFLASGDSPRQKSQDCTIHANLYGAACTFAAPGWNDRIANIIDEHDAKLTRADLALDFFDGLGYDMDQVKADYLAGLMDSGGKRLKCNMVGDWANGAERSFYIGSKEAGKQTNIYEKGDQLFGRDSDSQWVRVELRYGNKLRVLSSDMLRRPADFFGGASDWHLGLLTNFDAQVSVEKVSTGKKLAPQTVLGEVTRNVRWAMNTARQTIATAFEFLGESEFLELCNYELVKRPGRLKNFSSLELKAAFASVMGSFSAVESSSPAFS